jgi:hypothetical protein
MTADHFDPDSLLTDWPTTPAGLFPPGHPDGPPANPDTLPPGTTWGHTADGQRIPVYYDPPTPAPPPAAPQPIPAWAKTTALLMLTGSAAVGISAAGLAYAAESLDAIARGMVALAVVAACIAAAVVAVAACFRRDRGPAQVTHITQHVTATGWLGRAHGGSITKR